MIVGEQEWIGQYSDEEYDLFFKKIRKKIKKKVKNIKPRKIFNPIRTITAVPRFVRKKIVPRKKSSSQPSVNVQAKVNQAVQAKEVQLANDRNDLLLEVAAFEEKKVQEITKLDEAKVQTEQAKIDSEQGENKKMLYIGLSALGGLIIIGGIVVYIKSRQSQLNALKLQQIKTV
jgi:hypothetical protein